MKDKARRRAKAQVAEPIEAACTNLRFSKRSSNLMLPVSMAALADAVLQIALVLFERTSAFLTASKVSPSAAYSWRAHQ